MGESKARKEKDPSYGAGVKLKIIPEPKEGTRTVLAPDGPFPALKAHGTVNYICGSCGQLLLEGMERDGVQNIVIKCGKCGKYNEAAPASHLH